MYVFQDGAGIRTWMNVSDPLQLKAIYYKLPQNYFSPAKKKTKKKTKSLAMIFERHRYTDLYEYVQFKLKIQGPPSSKHPLFQVD